MTVTTQAIGTDARSQAKRGVVTRHFPSGARKPRHNEIERARKLLRGGAVWPMSDFEIAAFVLAIVAIAVLALSAAMTAYCARQKPAG